MSLKNEYPTIEGSEGYPRRRRARRARSLMVALTTAVAGCLAAGAPAGASIGHGFVSQLTTPLSGADALATDPNGRVFVTDPSTGAVDIYAGGALERSFGAGVLGHDLPSVAVDLSGKVYVVDREADVVAVFAPAGESYALLEKWTGANATGGSSFAEVAGVSVDNSAGESAGRVYVVDQGEGAVDIFAAPSVSGQEPNLLGTLGAKPKLEEPSAVAVSQSTGEVYIATESAAGPIVEAFAASGLPAGKFSGKETPPKSFGSIAALAVEASTGNVYVTDGANKAVDEFSATGTWLGWVPVADGVPFRDPHGVAVSPDGTLLVVDAALSSLESPSVDVFSAGVTVPDAKSEKAVRIERTSATLSGTINPREVQAGSPATYTFEYGESEAYGSDTRQANAESGETASKVSAPVTGLSPGTEYDYRLVARNAQGSSYGANVRFETPPAVSGLSTGPATAVEPAAATLTGALNGALGSTRSANPGARYLFEYGTSSAYGARTPEVLAPEAAGLLAVEAKPSALRPNTVYHYRIVASDSYGTSVGEDQVFKTAGAPVITIEHASAITHTAATLNAQIDPGERETSYFAEYGTTTAYGHSTTSSSLPAGEKAAPVLFALTGLGLATTYHYRFVAVNSSGPSVVGPDQEFTTALIESESAENVTSEGARLQARINPEGVPTSYRFEYGETSSYGTSIPSTAEEDEKLLTGTSPTNVQVSLTGLRADTLYHYRVVATLAGIGTGIGPDRTFRTPATAAAAFVLPDNRAYEMVSPPNKRGGYIEPLNRVGGAIQAAQDGGAFAFVVDGPIVEDPEGNRSPLPEQAIATRGPQDWHSEQIVAPHERAYGAAANTPPEYQLFSNDLALSVMQPFPFGLTPLAEPPLSPPLTAGEREVVREAQEPDRLNQEKTIYLRADSPVVPGAGEQAAYGEALHNGEVLAAERGEATPAPGFLPLVSAANVKPGAKFGGTVLESTHKGFPPTRVAADLSFRDATPDLSHAVLTSKLVALAPTGPSSPGLYEWSANELQLVSVLPAGAPTVGGSGAFEAHLGFESASRSTNFRNAISNDGSRVFWSIGEGGEDHQAGVGSLYMRDTLKHETVRIDIPETGPAAGETGRAEFQIASADGSRVFFTDTRRLTSDSSARTESAAEHIPSEPDLYECEVREEGGKLAACRLRDLTAAAAGESGSVRGLVQGASEDGTTIYFVADGALASGATRGSCGAVAFPAPEASCNLYEAHEVEGHWTTRLVGRLSREDAPDWFNTQQNARLLVDQTARVSPNGRFLAFMSNQRLTGYDNTDVSEAEGQPGEGTRHADEEVFLFDSATQALSCASCNPSGARPKGVFDTELAGEGAGLVVDRPQVWVSPGGQGGAHYNEGIDHWLAGNIPGWTAQTQLAAIYQSHYLSNEGRLFFNAADPLVAQAAHLTRNELIAGAQVPVGVENVYQYEPSAVGGCATAPGCVSMISSGTSERESAFLDASSSGGDVFFLTAAQLLPQDRDTAFDVYDARVCGQESPCQTASLGATGSCTDPSTCRAAGPSGTPFEQPATSTLATAGMVAHGVPAGQVLPARSKRLSRAQKLASALKGCARQPHRTHAQKVRRKHCEASARRRYGSRRHVRRGGRSR